MTTSSDNEDGDAPQTVVLHDVRGNVAWLTINRPQSRNALTPGVIAGLRGGIERALGDAAICAIVLTGSGDKAFCSGADLKFAASGLRPDPSRTTTEYADLLRAMMGCTLPIVARVNGHCMAGGMGLLAACDIAVTVESALFGLPEVKVGLFPMQVLGVLRSLIGERILTEMCLTGEPLAASDAVEAGLLNYVVGDADLDTKISWLLARLVDKSPTAQRRGKYALRAIAGQTWLAALPYLETQLATLATTEDAREGQRAFVERRPPVWTGK